MFLGKHSCTLDRKNRFLAPSAFREQFSGGFYITRGFDRNLLVFTTRAFQEIYHRVVSLNIADPVARSLLRLILSATYELRMDSNYLSIPGELKDFAHLDDKILLIGQGDYFEIWAPHLWSKQELELGDTESNSSRFSALTVSTR